MGCDQSLGRRLCALALVGFLALILIFQFDPTSPVFAVGYNETQTGGPNLDTGGESFSCDPEDPSCSDPGSVGAPPPGDIGGNPPPCDPQDPACSGGNPPPCDPQDPACSGGIPPCDPQDPACVITPCDPQDPACVITPCDPQDPACRPNCNPDNPDCTVGPPPNGEVCADGIDNNGNGLVDSDDPLCGGPGGPPTSSFPGGAASTPTEGASSFAAESNFLLTEAEATLPREDICDDGDDNDGNGLKDSEDPTCGSSEISFPGFKSIEATDNASEKLTIFYNNLTSDNLPTSVNNSNASMILITGANKHDVRTSSLFYYEYSREELTVDKGSKVIWINQDPSGSHGIKLIDKTSGKTIFSHPVIRYDAFASYEFQQSGEFMYFDSNNPSMMGQITVLN